MEQHCELCGIDIDGTHYSWELCNDIGLGVVLCRLCAVFLDAIHEARGLMLLQAAHRYNLDKEG
jgi:hypothetical protein